MQRFGQNLFPTVLILIGTAVLPWIPLLSGEFLFDDYQVIVANADLAKLGSFGDCFSFGLKPSKPVNNFVLALGHWWGQGMPWAQRLISLLLHVGVSLLVFFNLRLL